MQEGEVLREPTKDLCYTCYSTAPYGDCSAHQLQPLSDALYYQLDADICNVHAELQRLKDVMHNIFGVTGY